MKVYPLFLAASLLAACGSLAVAADPAKTPEQVMQVASKDGRLIYLLFYKEADAPTKAMVNVVKSAVASQAGQSTFAAIPLKDPASRAIATKYGVSRAPMPMVIAVHPNGAVTGYFQTKATEEDLGPCVVSPKKAECLKALQEGRLVFICLQTQTTSSIPQGVSEIQSDPHFAKRTQVLTLAVTDPAESSFLKSMEIDPQKATPQTLFLAPPGVFVGKFASNATKDQLAAQLAAAGKCCDDKNCKHNQQQPPQPRKATR
ncbi:MAG: hypothetical protein WD648_15380 [Planctomycetaceae bacterium]